MTAREILVKELETVKQGKIEAGEDAQKVSSIIDLANSGAADDELVRKMERAELKWFADKLAEGVYDMMAAREN